MRIAREEIFGPVANVIRAKDYDEALHLANDTEFGLSSGICTTSLKYASHFKRNAEAGMVMVNVPTAGVDYHVPFGGSKGSSYGPREQGSYAAEFYTTVKTAYTRCREWRPTFNHMIAATDALAGKTPSIGGDWSKLADSYEKA